MIPKGTKIYIVEWIDSYSPTLNKWEHFDDVEDPSELICISVGWIIKENDKYITIVSHISDITNKEGHGEVCGNMTIPKKAIKSKKLINYKR